jgi:ribosomal protein L37AE/L43A
MPFETYLPELLSRSRKPIMNHDEEIAVSIYCPHCRELVVKRSERNVRIVACQRCHSLFSIATALKAGPPPPVLH